MNEGLAKLYKWTLERLQEAQNAVLGDRRGYELMHWAGKIDAYNRTAEEIVYIMHEEESK